MRKRIISLFAVLILLYSVCITAFAHDVPDITRKGSIQITMRHGQELLPGGSITLFRVGEVCENNGDFGFSLTGDFKNSQLSLEDIKTAVVAETFEKYANENDLRGSTKEIGQDGKVIFDDLELGLYLLVQYDAAEGYNCMNSFLISVPGLEDGQYVYDVDGSPKMSALEKKPVEVEQPDDSEAPRTGEFGHPFSALVSSGLSLLVVSGILFFRKQKKSYEA